MRTFLLLVALTMSVWHYSFAVAPTVPPTNFNVSYQDGNRLTISFSTGNGAKRIIIARAGEPVTSMPVDGVDYNFDNEFGDGDELNPGEYVVFDNVSSAATIYSLAPGTTYYFSIFEYNGSGVGTEYLQTPLTGSATTLSAPTVQVSSVSFNNVTGSSMNISWTDGDGARRLVLVKAGSAVDANPNDLSTYYATSTFGSGSQIGTGNYVVYGGASSSITIYNLQPGITYHIAIFEYNGFSGPVYLVPGVAASTTTVTTPTQASTNLNFTNIDGNRLSGNFTGGDGVRRMIVMKEGSEVTGVPVDGQNYATSTTFGNGDQLGAGEYVVANGASTSFSTIELQPDQEYFVKIFEYNGTQGNNTYYLTDPALSGSIFTLGAPAMGVDNIQFNNITGNSLTISWTNGDGDRRLVIAREASAVNYTPVQLYRYSTGVSTNFGVASDVGSGNKVLYAGTANSINVTGLNPGTDYYFEVFEYNGLNGPVYRIPGTTANTTTDDSPPGGASNINFYSIEGNRMSVQWTNGTGSRRMVVARLGAPVTAIPTDGTQYSASANFGSGDDLGGDQFVVYDGTGSAVQVYSLVHSTEYYFKVFEYYGTGTYTIYQTSEVASGSQSTPLKPTVEATNIQFPTVLGNSLDMSWDNGDGTYRIVVCKEGSPLDMAPNDYTRYNSSSTFGSGSSNIGMNNYVVYQGDGSSFTLNGLDPGVTYYFKIYEYNSYYAPVYIDGPTSYQQTTLAVPPTTPATNLGFTQIGAGQMQLSWTSGNGSRRMVVARAGAAVDADPQDHTAYTANTTIGDGDEIGTGNFVVYNGTGNGFTVYGLETSTVYHFAIYEYNISGANIYYLTPGATGNRSTASPPSTAPSNLTVSNLSATSVQVGWTNGDGIGRMLVVSESAPLNDNPVDGTSYIISSTFGSSGSIIGNGQVVYRSTGTQASVYGLQTGTTYYCSLFEYNGLTGSPAFLQTPGTTMHTTDGPPQIQASDPMTMDIQSASVTIEWTPGSGQRRLILMREVDPVNATPVNGQDYTPNSAFGAGAQLGDGNYAVYKGNGSSTTITGLTPGTLYHLAIFEYNFTGSSTQYLTADPAEASLSTSLLPVECIEFKATEITEGIALHWITATEVNNEGFSLQRSTDGRHYQEIAWIDGYGNSSEVKRYEWLDRKEIIGQRYYRLLQYDWDGQWAKACQIIQLLPGSSSPNWQISPNPGKGPFQITGIPDDGSGQVLLLYNSLGKVVQKFHIESAAGQQTTIDLSPLSPGTYWLKWPQASGKKVLPLIITK